MKPQLTKISIPVLLAVVVVYLIIVQGLPFLTASGLDADYGEFPDVETVVRGVMAPVAASILFVVVVVTSLGWWRPVLRDDRPVERWVWIVPLIMIVTVLLVTDYANLSDLGGRFTITLLCTALMVGVGEELMFRGVGVIAFRINDFREPRVALWSSIVFGAAHITNIISEGPSSIVQVIVVSFSGFFFYLIRRVSGGIALPIVMHGLWDFSLFSGHAGEDPEVYPLAALALVCNIALLVTLWVRGDKIGIDREPAEASVSTG